MRPVSPSRRRSVGRRTSGLRRGTRLSTVLLASLPVAAGWASAARTSDEPGARLRFDFGSGKVAAGYTAVTASTVYGRRGYGIDLGSVVACPDHGGNDALRGDVCTSDAPFFFSVDVPEGNYRVTVTLGDGASTTTVRAESRRLMLERIHTEKGVFTVRSFTVNVRGTQIVTDGPVRLKERERGVLHWDDKLTLEFAGDHPSVAALEVTKVDDAVTVFLAGDSTVTDQTREPWASWGQMLPRFFDAGVAVANHAESGETLRAFRAEGRLAKVLSQIRAGDYLFLQFAHNDQKPGPNHLDAFTSYQHELLSFADEARRRGATPVLVTSMPRRRFDDAGRILNTLGDYPEAVRQLARREQLALIDLNAAATTLFEALGGEGSKQAFVHFPAKTFPGQDEELKDDTHFRGYGAYELARAVVAGIERSGLGLASHLIDVGRFDPAHPDPPAAWSLPPSPPLPLVPAGGPPSAASR
jgi:lysophospholipase L1-like esterase